MNCLLFLTLFLASAVYGYPHLKKTLLPAADLGHYAEKDAKGDTKTKYEDDDSSVDSDDGSDYDGDYDGIIGFDGTKYGYGPWIKEDYDGFKHSRLTPKIPTIKFGSGDDKKLTVDKKHGSVDHSGGIGPKSSGGHGDDPIIKSEVRKSGIIPKPVTDFEDDVGIKSGYGGAGHKELPAYGTFGGGYDVKSIHKDEEKITPVDIFYKLPHIFPSYGINTGHGVNFALPGGLGLVPSHNIFGKGFHMSDVEQHKFANPEHKKILNGVFFGDKASLEDKDPKSLDCGSSQVSDEVDSSKELIAVAKTSKIK